MPGFRDGFGQKSRSSLEGFFSFFTFFQKKIQKFAKSEKKKQTFILSFLDRVDILIDIVSMHKSYQSFTN